MGSPLREALGVTIASLALAAALALIGSRIPRSTGPVEPLGSWTSERMVVSGAWVVAAAGCLYGLVVGLLGIIVAGTDNRRALRLMDRLAPRMARRIVAGVTLASFATTLVATSTPGGRTTNEVATGTSAARGSLHDDTTPPGSDPLAAPDMGPPIDAVPAADTTPTGTAAPASAAPAEVALDTTSRGGNPTVEPHPPAPGATNATLTSGTLGDQVVGDDWTVRPGDNFWAIARATLASHGTNPNDADIARYWSLLIDANRGRLIDPDNADLIVVGQRLTLPASSGSTTPTAP